MKIHYQNMADTEVHYEGFTATSKRFVRFPVRAYLSKEEALGQNPICRWRWAWWEYVHEMRITTLLAEGYSIYWLPSIKFEDEQP